MINLFSRVQLMVANDQQQVENALVRLRDAGIKSSIRTERMSGQMYGIGWIYYLYVDKKDLEEARSIMGLQNIR